MSIGNKREPFVLFAGDVVFFLFALWLALFARYGIVPVESVFLAHAVPFLAIFCVWIFVFFIAGLYEKHTLVLKSRLPTVILNAQIANSVIAVLFFYILPEWGLTPKTILFLDLLFSFGLITLWRIFIAPAFGVRKKQNALLIGAGDEVRDLKKEVNENAKYGFTAVSSIDLDATTGVLFRDEIREQVYSQGVSLVVIDLANDKVLPILSHLYNLIFSGVRFVDIHRVYEDIFDRVPISSLNYNWFLEHVSSVSHVGYDTLKRSMDIVVSAVLGVLSLPLYPLVFLALWLDDGGGMWSRQERVGKNSKPIRLLKFRTMSFDDGGKWEGEGRVNKVTRVGKFLRAYRIDELPQLWNVLAGDISLIGPRPEFFDAVKKYEKNIEYYGMRHLIAPGLSGWAQVYHKEHPHHAIDIEETRHKLSYDLYYVKNRSFLLDIRIALKTIAVLLSRSGR